MDEWVKDVLEEEKRKRKIPLEVKRLNGNYYLYHSTTKYDRERHGARKVSEYIGRITENGIVENDNSRSVYEYGNSELIYSVSKDIIKLLKKYFPDTWESIYAMSVVRLIDYTPLKMVKERWDKLYMSRYINAHVSSNTLTDLLVETGSDISSQYNLFNDLMHDSMKLAFDLSSIFSRSENINMAEKGHNHEHEYIPQINIAMVFDLDYYRPVFLKSLDGSVRDIKSLKKVLEEINFNGILVMDRGFASYSLADEINNKFIMPLRRNNKIIDYNAIFKSSFMYRDRGILSTSYKYGKYYVYIFQDQILMSEEANTFISLIADNKKNQEDFNNASKVFGKIAILSNIDDYPENIYLMYKQREEIEQSFDAMKNELENDKSYLSNDDSIRGYFFISFVSLYIYYSIFVLIRAAGLTDKLSVKDALLKYSRVYKIIHNNKEIISEIPASSEKIDEQLGTNIFPKKLWS